MSVGAANQVAAATQSLSSPGTNAGAINGAPDRPIDQKEAQTAPKFGELLQTIQSKYGARPEKGREIKKTLGKDDFLRIMITQMKNQDPTNPFKAEQMAAEMAQFTSVEQLKNMNETLTKMTTANQPLERMAMTGMIGKTITIDRGRFPHQEGSPDSLSFGLPRDAASVELSLVNEQGETVFQQGMGKLKAGENTFNWDGKKVNGLPAKSGNYMIRVEATDPQGRRIETDATAQARVVGVSFEGAEPVFLVGDNQRQEKVTMKSIVRIDSNGGEAGAGVPGGGIVGASSAGAGAPKAAPTFFTFQKGVGSQNFDATTASPDAQKAIASYQAAGGQSAAPAQGRGPAQEPIPPSERGFPNGLQDDSDKPTSDNPKGGEIK